MITTATKTTTGRKGREHTTTYLHIEGTVTAHREDQIKGIRCEISTIAAEESTIEVYNLRPYGGELPPVGSHVTFAAETDLGIGGVYMTTGIIPLEVR